MNRGVTLIETMIVSSLFMVLTGLLFAGWASSAKAWTTASQRGDIVSTAQTMFRKLDRSLETSTMGSVEIEPSAESFGYAAPGAPASGEVTLTATGDLTYERYLVCYWIESSAQVQLAEHLIPTSSSASFNPPSLSLTDIGQGIHPLNFYRHSGRIIGEGITAFSATLEGRVLQIQSELTTPKGTTGNYTFSVLLRN